MAPLPGTDSSAQLQPMQDRWLALVASGMSDTEAARQAGYKAPRQAAYDNRNSPLAWRIVDERIRQAATLFEADLDEVSQTSPLLVPFVVLLRHAVKSTKSVKLVAFEERPDARGRLRRYKTVEVIEDVDNMAQIKAAELLLRLSGMDLSRVSAATR